MSVIIKIDTGFVGGEHHVDTGYSKEEWSDLSQKEKNQTHNEAVWNHIYTQAVDEETGEKLEG